MYLWSSRSSKKKLFSYDPALVVNVVLLGHRSTADPARCNIQAALRKKSKRMLEFYVNLISQVYVSLIIVYFPSTKFICNCFLDSGQYTEYKINIPRATAIVCFLVWAKKASINM